MIISIHQPNYFPWAGYFYKVNKANTFIFLDDAQYSKNSFINRSYIIENLKKSWLTIPVKILSNSIIKEVSIADKDWKQKHLSKLKNSYKKTVYFDEVWSLINNIYDKIYEYNISQINKKIISETSSVLKIPTEFVSSSDLDIDQNLKGEDRLIALIKKIGGKVYFSGQGGKNYQNKEKFLDNGIKLIYSSYIPEEYKQESNIFYPGASILDMLFNIGVKKSITSINQN